MSHAQPQLCVHVTNDPMFGENGYTVHMRDHGPCWIIDPGLPPQPEQIIEYVHVHDLKPEKIVLTHAHADHIAGIDPVRDALGALPVYLAKAEWNFLIDPMANLSGAYGTPCRTNVTDPIALEPGDALQLDGARWEVRDGSGHSPGGRVLYCASLGVLFSGDTLFAGSVGRVDFPHSNGETLMNNIHDNLLSLPDDTRVLSGHGPETTIGRERVTNPFVLHGL